MRAKQSSCRFIDLPGMDFPIIQAPMAVGTTTPDLVAAVSQAEALDSLGAAYLHQMKAADLVRKLAQEIYEVQSSGASLN